MDEDDDPSSDSVKTQCKKAQMTFRRLEIRAKTWQTASSILIFLFLLVVYPLGFTSPKDSVQAIILVERFLLFGWCAWVFGHLYYSMKKMHKYEFSKNKRLLQNQFLVISISQISRIAYLIVYLSWPMQLKDEACHCLC
mmetsp:Transcript_3239/g.4927  ORF Transcript_3239/g.4927 Transcript_3239/m.4927 type:complete len:139 (+) Transcript_3239:681-1097(+)